MSPQELEARLLAYVNEHLVKDGIDRVERETPLFAGVLTSLRLIELLAFVEKTLEIHIPDELIVMDRFATVERIASSFARLERRPNDR